MKYTYATYDVTVASACFNCKLLIECRVAACDLIDWYAYKTNIIYYQTNLLAPRDIWINHVENDKNKF